MIDPITDGDLTAYVDGQLDAMRRLDVEAHLAAHPEVAARVMAEMHDRDALRVAFSPLPGPGPDRNRGAARRLDRTLRWRRVTARLRRAAAVAILVGAGWLAHDEIGQFGVPDSVASTVDPVLIEDARRAREVAQLRIRIGGQARTPDYDRAGLAAATGIDMPALPPGWRAQDVQVFPARSGTAIEVALEAGTTGPVSLFATRHASGDGEASVASAGDGATVYWTAAGTAYALSGTQDEAALRQAATLLRTTSAPR